MFDACFVNPNYISQIPKMCEENTKLRVVYITDDVPVIMLFNAKYSPALIVTLVSALVNNEG